MDVLIVDDNLSITTMLEKYLTIKGFTCTVSNDGRNGLTLIENKHFDAVILDLAMPDFSGIRVIENLSKSGKINETKIIVLTASIIDEEQIQKLRDQGVFTILKKPAELNVLLEALKS